MPGPRGALMHGTRKGGGTFTYAAPGPQVVDPLQCVVSVVGGGTTVASTAAKTLRLQLKDSAGINVTTATGLTVVPTKAGGSSTGTLGGIVDNQDGTLDYTYTGIVAGTAQTLGATINGVSIGVPTTLSVVAGAIDRTVSVVTVSAPTATIGGAVITLTLQAKDAAGNNLTAGGSTVVLGTAGGTSTGTLGSGTDVGNGTYTRAFTATGLGTATTATATIGGQSVTTTMPTITVDGVYDSFTRADGPLGSAWGPAEPLLGTFLITNNAVGCRTVGGFRALYVGSTFNADCSSELTLAPGFTTTDVKKPPQAFVRRDAATLYCYAFFVDPIDVNGLQIKYDGGPSTVILAQTTRVVPLAGDVWKLTVKQEGSPLHPVLRGYLNGVLKLTYTDTLDRLTAAGGSGFGAVPKLGNLAADDQWIGDWTGKNL